jgi:septal ring factor EnvC (AmiA/AmiB activator)
MLSLEPLLARAREELAAELAKIERVRPLVEARQERERLGSQLAAATEESRRLESERHELAARLDELRAQSEQQRAAMTAELAQLETRLTDASSARDRLSAHVSELKGHVSHLDAEIIALRQSWSWRITGPLRRLYGALNRSNP